MLQSLPFEGTIKVRNKGVDVTLLADADTVELAFTVSRTLVVCGISTAVLEITCWDPIDTRTLSYYEQTTRGIIAMDEAVWNAVRPYLAASTPFEQCPAGGKDELIAAARRMSAHKK